MKLLAQLTLAAALAVTATAPAAAGPTDARVADPAAAGAAEIAFRRGAWIHVGRADGTGIRRLTRGAAPAWSPDGTRLAYSHRDRIYVMDAATRRSRRLTTGPGDTSPAWSPDGRRIAFASRRSGAFEVYVMKADGSRIRRLTFRARRDEDAHAPAWSPDGRLIAYGSNRPALFNPEVYVMRADGTGRRRLTFTKGGDALYGDDGMPAWSPDGARIVFASNRSQDGSIWTMAADGTGQRELFGLVGTDEWDPAISPDGGRIAFARVFADGHEELWMMGADGAGARRVTAGAEPAWRPAPALSAGQRP